MNDAPFTKVLGCAMALAVVAPTAASAAPRPLPQRILSRGAVSHAASPAAPRAVHDLSGTIVSLHGNALSLRLRSGRVQLVDATDASASGRVSAPLFAGKLVEIAGTYDARHTLRASSVTRVPRVDATTPADR